MKTKNRFWGIVSAAGTGKRFGENKPKQYLTLRDKPVIVHSVSCITTHPLIHSTVVVIAKNDPHWLSVKTHFSSQKIITAIGGSERCISVYNGLLALQQQADVDDWILVHDAVRPCLQHADIDHLIATLQHHPVGGLLGIRVPDTLKQTHHDGHIISTVNRADMWQAQTPQMFRYGLLREALKTAIEKKQFVTDEASAVEYLGKQPLMVEGSAYNIKITYPEDLQRAALFLQRV